MSDPWGMRKKMFFEIFIFTLFIGIFLFFPYITLVNFSRSVCPRATGHILGLSDPWDMRLFCFSEIFIFTLFIGIFRFVPYITLVNFWFQATGHSFSPRNVILG